jgi:hypothetical protein
MESAEPMTTVEPNTKHLEKAEHRAQVEWWRRLINRKRKAEGTFDGDTGKFTPSENEAPRKFRDDSTSEEYATIPDLTPRQPGYFHKSHHIWNLVQRACRGEQVPADIATSFLDEYGKIHEKHMKGAVAGAMKREDEAHVKKQREIKRAAKEAEAKSTAARIAHKEELIKNLQRKVRLLETKIQKHRRSISALKTAAARKAKP